MSIVRSQQEFEQFFKDEDASNEYKLRKKTQHDIRKRHFKYKPEYSLLKLRVPDQRVSISEPKPKAS